MILGSINFREARLTDLSGIVKVNVDTWKTTYQGIISDEYLQNLSYKDKEGNWKQKLEKSSHGAIIYVAENNFGEIIGFTSANLEMINPISSLSLVDRITGELCAIYVLKDFQRKKIGTELVKLVVKYFIESNIQSMIVWVLKVNPYRRFYEKLGGTCIGEQLIEIGGRNYSEIAYFWENFNKLLIKSIIDVEKPHLTE